jgi:hypothetical protein
MRVYMNIELETVLLKKLHEVLKKKIEGGEKIWKVYKKYTIKKVIILNIKKIIKKINIWRELDKKLCYKIKINKINILKKYVK